MLAELTLLLHEMSDSLRGRRATTDSRHVPRLSADSHDAAVVLITGLASPGKARLVDALQRRLTPAQVTVRVHAGPQSLALDPTVLHVHAETDVEAMVEGGLQTAARDASKGAAVLVPVDWEPVERSVTRVIDMLVARGLGVAALGA